MCRALHGFIYIVPLCETPILFFLIYYLKQPSKAVKRNGEPVAACVGAGFNARPIVLLIKNGRAQRPSPTFNCFLFYFIIYAYRYWRRPMYITKLKKKEDKLKFIDVMTSLKNRNYLNYNIKRWDDNVIYPQAIVIIDLNNLKYINDNYGHAEGDELIKKAASILIINQQENTDIVRTDGNEFLIYMVGYEEKKVIEYTRKINKELKELPHGFGATLGYSMIEDDIKTIDDAINEATLSMRQAKEKI